MVFEIFFFFFFYILETVEDSFLKKHDAIQGNYTKEDFYQLKWLYNNTWNI